MTSVKNIVLGVTGSIAAYKSAEIVRLLTKSNFNVKVIMTGSAQQFVHANTFSALSQQPVYHSVFDPDHAAMMHIELAKWADLILIAPITASFLAKLALGLADDLLSTVCLVATVKILLAPAMNKNMWSHVAVQNNLKQLKAYGYEIFNPELGEQACGDYGPGRMLEPEKIVSYIKNQGPLKEKTVLITAGPTREPLDPVRFISNHSSGKMGYALAEVCCDLGAIVTLISGPVALAQPAVHEFIGVNTADEMHQAVMRCISEIDIFISCAAVADYKPKKTGKNKIKKSLAEISLDLVATKDILSEVSKLSKKPFLVGFALETENLIENAKHKLVKKKLDIIIANLLDKSNLVFNSDQNEGVFFSKKTGIRWLEKESKKNMAKRIMGLIIDEAKTLVPIVKSEEDYNLFKEVRN